MPKRIPTRKPKDRYHHGDLRAALIRAGRELLNKEGLDALSLRGVARRVGVSEAAPYSHFEDKRALLVAIAATGYRELTVLMKKGFAEDEDPVLRMRAMARYYCTFAGDNPELYRLMAGQAVMVKIKGQKNKSRVEMPTVGTLPGAVDPELMAAWGEGLEVIQRGVAALVGPAATPRDAGVGFTLAWVIVHGLSQLIIDRRVSPEMLGFKDVASLVTEIARYFVFAPPGEESVKPDSPG